MFEKASRLKLRFNTLVGDLSVEDLWDLPLTGAPRRLNLDDIAIALDKEMKEKEGQSFVKKNASASVSEARLKFDIVLRIIQVRQAEAEAAETKRSAAEKKQKLLELIAEKQDEDLKGKSIDELQALVNTL